MTALEITKALGGQWHGSYGYVRCVSHPDKRPSLRLRDGERGQLLVYCHAGCDSTHILQRLRAEHVTAGPVLTESERLAAEARQAKADQNRKLDRARQAYAIWRAARNPTGSPAEAYLRARGITTLALPRTLRHGRLKHRSEDFERDCLIAAVQQPDNDIAGVQRIFLEGVAKAPMEDAKMSIGNLSGGAVRLALAAEEMAVGEGIETCLSFQQLTGIPTWAALSTSGLKTFNPPGICKHLHILVDNDANDAGHKAAEILTARLKISAEWRRSPVGKDWNDMLTKKI